MGRKSRRWINSDVGLNDLDVQEYNGVDIDEQFYEDITAGCKTADSLQRKRLSTWGAYEF